MGKLMRCLFCGLLQDEPKGVKTCSRCGGELVFKDQRTQGQTASYMNIQMELDQIYAPAGENIDRYLLLTLKTPKQVPTEFQPPQGKKRPSVNFAPVLDKSGSMHGPKIEHAKQAVLDALNYLQTGDVFSLVTYQSEPECLFEPQEVNSEILQKVRKMVQQIQSGSSTALHAGLELGIQKASKMLRDANLVLLLSDGLANQGITDLEIIGQLAKQAHAKGQTVSTIGIGLDYNEALMAEVAEQGGGHFYHIEDPSEIPSFIAGELGEAANWAARDVQLHLEIPPGTAVLPLLAKYQVSQKNENVVISIGDLPCDAEVEIALRLVILPQKKDDKLTISGKLQWSSPNGKDLQAPINSVTMRFVDSATYMKKQGIVQPVAVKVLQQWKDISVLNLKRAMSSTYIDENAEREKSIKEIRTYASRLGEEQTVQELNELEKQFDDLSGPSFISKQVVYGSYARTRGQKDFGKGNK